MTKLSVDQALMKASYLLKKNEPKEAYKIYKSVLIAFPKNIRAQQGLLNLNKTKKNNSKQVPSKEILSNVVTLYNHGYFSRVVKETELLIENFPNTAFLWNILGASAFKIDLLDKAIEAYRKAISINPNYDEAYSNMGAALKKQGKIEEAISAYYRSISLNPKNS